MVYFSWVKYVFSAKSEGRTCEYNGRIYQNGESFRAGCKHQCTCIDGAVGCAPLCSNKLPPASPSCPYPRLVRIPGQCCFSVDCHRGTWRLPPKHQVCFFVGVTGMCTQQNVEKSEFWKANFHFKLRWKFLISILWWATTCLYRLYIGQHFKSDPCTDEFLSDWMAPV